MSQQTLVIFLAFPFLLALADPIETNATAALSGFRARQQELLAQVLTQGDNIDNLWLKVNNSLPIDETIIDEILLSLVYEDAIDLYNSGNGSKHVGENPDFRIVPLIRLMQFTDQYNNQTFERFKRLHFWYGKGDDYRVYWSENHMIMWTGSAFLLSEMFPNESFQFDENMRSRLLWYLKAKQQTEFYEWVSSIYSSFTFFGMMNVYDFTQDAEIKEEARKAILAQIRHILRHTDVNGCVNAIGGRNHDRHYFDRAGCSDFRSDLAYLVLGVGNVGTDVDNRVAFLAASDIDVTDVILEYSDTIDGTFKLGVSYEEGLDLMKELTKEDRITAQMSMGGYAAPEYFADFMHNLDYFELWNSSYFQEFSVLETMPKVVYPLLSWVASSRGASSVLYTEKEKLYRHKGAMINSIEEYFPGYGGAQQMVFVASSEGVATFTESGSPSKDAQVVNNHLPYVKQTSNVALLLYYPNWDLPFTGLDEEFVFLSFEVNNYNEVVESGKWLFGRVNDSYVGIHRHCVSEFEDNFAYCYDQKQVWLSIVGHADTHGSFSNFISIAETSDIKQDLAGMCVQASASIDGKELGISFCRNMGAIFTFIVLLCVLGVGCFGCCFVCCRKDRKIWKRTFKNAKENSLVAYQRAKEKTSEMKHYLV